jgi:hypothetical protein
MIRIKLRDIFPRVYSEGHNLCSELDVGSIEILLPLPPVGASPAYEPAKDTTLQFRIRCFRV